MAFHMLFYDCFSKSFITSQNLQGAPCTMSKAASSLMILRSYKGLRKTVGKQHMKSHFLLAAVKKITSEFPILREARREVLEDLMDMENAKLVLRWIEQKQV